MTAARQRTGARAEELVARRLATTGWEIVERNPRTRYGELDIVALDGSTLVFVEVKAGREGNHFGPERPALAVDRRKQQRVRRLATAWMAERRDQIPRFEEIRFDVVGITFDRAGRATDVEHIANAF
jgi:putative endonuclease